VSLCSNCGSQNPDRARFCSNCGRPLAAPVERHEARKVVTVVFCDVADSTGLAERLDAEVVRNVMSRYFEEMRAVLERHGGTVEKFIGDAVMAVFGVPSLHEDDALRAVAAAAEMGAARDALNAELESRWGVRVATRTGVNTGEVMAGDPSHGDSFVIGDAVNVAARLEQKAAIGEVLLGDTTARLVRAATELEDAGVLEVKGKAGGVRAWRLVRMAERRSGRWRSPGQLVGRGEQLAALESSFNAVLEEGACRVVTVLGPAGIGKTRLADELLARVEDRARVARGRCLPYGTVTFWPLAEVVRQLAGFAADAPAEDAERAITALLPDGEEPLARRVAAAIGIGAGDTSYPEETFAAVRRLFEQGARERPLVILFDDLQWAEPTFLGLVEHLTRFARKVPLLILCLSRVDLLDARPGWGGESGTMLTLEPLDGSETSAVLEQAAGGAALPDPVVRLLQAAAGGNPLFAEEMLRMLLEEDALERDNGNWRVRRELDTVPVPPTISAVLAARLERLPPAERTVIERAAVIGKDFQLQAVAGLCEQLEADAIDDQLEALAGKHIVAPGNRTEGDHGYRFVHLLMRDVAYAGMPKSLRADLHERFAELLEERRTGFDGEPDEVVGYHLEQAHVYRRELGSAGGLARLGRRAAQRLSAAGERASARGDLPAAVGLMRRAADLLPAFDPERLALLPRLGEALCDVGELAAAQEVLTDALSTARQTGDRRAEAEAALARAYARSFDDPEGGLQDLREQAEAAIGLYGELGDSAGLARAWQSLAIVHVGACQWRAAEQARRQGLEHARAAGDHGLELRALSGLAYALYFGPSPVGSAIPAVEEILERTRGYPVAEGAVLGVLGGLMSMLGRFDEARDLHRRGREIFEGLGPALPVAEGALNAADSELLAGEPGAAERLLRGADAALEAVGEVAIRASVAAELAQALYEQGRADEAVEFAALSEAMAAADDVQAQVAWRAARALVLADRGDAEAAESVARQAVETARATDDPNLSARALLAHARALQACDRAADADAALAEALQLYDAKGNVAARERAAATPA
jgi:class 3 adenylate cyclase/tetratricopeptide (TPR) repeat protein